MTDAATIPDRRNDLKECEHGHTYYAHDPLALCPNCELEKNRVAHDEHGPATPAPTEPVELPELVKRNIVGRQMRVRLVVQAIMDHPGFRAVDLERKISVPASTISQDIAVLVAIGLITKRPAKGGGSALYFFNAYAIAAEMPREKRREVMIGFWDRVLRKVRVANGR